MSSPDTLQRRLTSLRSLTQALRDSSAQAPLNLHHLKHLLQNTKQLYTPDPPPPTPAPLPLYRPLFPENSEDSHLGEVVQLREENMRLEEQLETVRTQLAELQRQENKIEQPTAGTTPFFRLAELLQGFVCRLKIGAEQAGQVDYSAYEVELKLDRLIAIRQQKAAQQQFDLGSLVGVRYTEKVMVLQFRQFEQSVGPPLSFFLKFDQPEHLHRWDLAIFTNYHIVTSLNEPRLFQAHFRRVNREREEEGEKSNLQQLRMSHELDESHQKDLLKLLIKRREQYFEVKKLIGDKIQKVEQRKNMEESQHDRKPQEKPANLEEQKKEAKEAADSGVKPQTKLDKQDKLKPKVPEPDLSEIPRIDEIDEFRQESHQDLMPVSNHFHVRHTDSNLIDYAFRGPSLPNPTPIDYAFRGSSLTPITDAPRQQYPLSPPPLAPSRPTYTDTQRDSKVSIVNQLGIFDGRNRSIESQSRHNSSGKLNQASKRLSTARINLQTGYYATKYSKDGFNPHEKKVFLSIDCKKLCWSDKDKTSEYKSIPIQVVIDVMYDVLGQGIVKHVKNPDSKYFCVVNYLTGDYKKKTIELGSGNMEDIRSFASDLDVMLKNRKQ